MEVFEGNIVTEEWRATHHPKYEVSNLGQVRSWAKRHPAHFDLTAPRILQCSRTNGYPSVGFWPDKTRHFVHKLVLAAFVGPRPDGQQALHRDDNPENARLDNLRYGTPLENVQDMRAKGRWTRCKFSDQQVRDIRLRFHSLRQTPPARRLKAGALSSLASEHKVTRRCIEALWSGPNYRHV